MPRQAHAGDWLALAGLAALWGSAFLFIDLALRSFTPAIIVAARVGIAAIVLLAVRRASRSDDAAATRDVVGLTIMALLGTVVPFHLTAWALQHIESALTGILMAVVPLFVLGLGHFFLPGHRITIPRAIGFSTGFAGVLCIIGPEASNLAPGNMQIWGILAVLGAALSYSINAIYVRRRGVRHPVSLATGVTLVAALISLPAALLDLPQLTMPVDGFAVLALGVLGLFCTGFASVLYFRVVQGPGPAFMSQVSYLIPVVAVVVGVMFLDEKITLPALTGLSLIIAGIALSEFGEHLQRAIAVASREPLPAAAATEEI